MARRNKAQRNLNRTGRMTPYDAKVAGTFAERPRAERAPPRAPTEAETHANNYAKVVLGRSLGNVATRAATFREDLAVMNDGKRGRPYEFSDSLILWMMSVMTFFDGDYRGTAGFQEPILWNFGIAAPSFTRFQERCHELVIEHVLDDDSELRRRYGKGMLATYVSPYVADRLRRVAIDATGLSLSCHNRWREMKWDTGTKNRGWLHFHVMSDLDSGEILAYAVTDESIGDSPMLEVLVDMAAKGGHVFEEIYADGAYAGDRNWIYLTRENRYRFITSFKVNTKPTKNGCEARGLAAECWCETPYAEWTIETGYHRRWKVETMFSDFKELFPETVSARSVTGMVGEVESRVAVFNEFKQERATLMRVTGNGVVIGRRRTTAELLLRGLKRSPHRR